MADSRYNTLLIIEGESCEKTFFDKLSQLITADKSTTIVSFANDIYELYKLIKNLDYDTTTKDVILQYLPLDESVKNKIKSTKFVNTYLIFDLDLQNDPETEQINNLNKVSEMLKLFNDETGDYEKLFINYPMMESYRDFYFSNENSLKDRNIVAKNVFLTDYKNAVGQRGTNKNIRSYKLNDFYKICKAHLMQSNLLLNNSFTKPTQKEYDIIININNVHNMQSELIKTKGYMLVLNTSSFLYSEFYPTMLKNKN